MSRSFWVALTSPLVIAEIALSRTRVPCLDTASWSDMLNEKRLLERVVWEIRENRGV